jgi:predicted DNA-binding transcriptional regulator AlpA
LLTHQHDLRRSFPSPAFAAAGAVARSLLRDDDLATPEDIARMTGMSVRWVYETFSIPAKGGVRPMKIGNKSRWYTWEVKGWIAAQHKAADHR